MSQKILILEDNKAHMEALRKIIEDIHGDIEVYYVNNVERACQIALEQRIHLFLLDIVLSANCPGDVSGLNFAREIRGISRYKFTPLIFITSLQDPKLFSFSQLHCFGYIEKPFQVARVRSIILDALEFPVKEDVDRHIYFKKNGIVYSKSVKKIVYIENIRRKLIIHSVDDDLEIPYKTCEEILKELDSDAFVQCSRYTIINRNYVEQIDYTNRYVRLKNVDELIEIGVIMQKAFRQRMEDC